jgi:hypothetical protein
MVIEDWQEDLKKVTLRINWDDPKPERRDLSRNIYITATSGANILRDSWRACEAMSA